ncbi:DUF4136 domain-containing protein [Robiginitalea sp. M366]|uniref:DUF4136 domain-containing protein n=1 Tax=Robiginitalea aestuariiviva TaxID=3036903 RepID=UPI00240E32F1|nr:DUF4136 domain-containing protein [Robiginitalea aestuariiviva]MDG1571969.1 DUF4136 domain-containing protein [Robiginitalea aestuariiviva]
MRTLLKLTLIVAGIGLLGSCTSVRVLSDYERSANFGEYQTYAFYKTGIDKAQISDLDKKRILRAIEAEMNARGMVKSENPDLLVSIFTTEKERVNVYNNNFGWGWGWGPYWGGAGWWGPGMWGPNVSTRTEGALYIDLIDARKKELVWQGRGTGTLGSGQNIEKKEARIREFVSRILSQYPPDALVAN